MNVEYLPITDAPGYGLQRIRTAEDVLEIAEIYVTAFPEEERRPLRAQARAARREEALFYRIVREGQTVGMFTAWELPRVVYGEHFAVGPRVRAKGLGTKVLRTIMQATGKPLFGEVEPPVDELTTRRLNFYLREGFHVLDREYYQPPYTPELPPVRLLLLSTDPDLRGERLEQTIADLFATVFVKHI
ncbi:MAG: GNAT family acetyltransferase [Bacteroidia bacterium]|nr:MAG: GNAT family acetyltransferase [Bacteroidia bacterium]